MRQAWRNRVLSSGERAIPEETALALSYNRFAYAVMMGTPADLEDFATGFSVSEGVVKSHDEIEDIEIVENEQGVELRCWIAEERIAAFTERRRHIAGPTGCGLCGLESLKEAMRAPRHVVSDFRTTADELAKAIAAMPALQTLNRETRAVHAAAFWQPEKGIVALREDVGRHNALDKLGGALLRADVATTSGALLMTSRVSVELIQKAAIFGMPILVAVSAPTALALRMAEEAGITLAAIARDDGFDVFTGGERIDMKTVDDVARQARLYGEPDRQVLRPSRREESRCRGRRSLEEILGSAHAHGDLPAPRRRRRRTRSDCR